MTWHCKPTRAPELVQARFPPALLLQFVWTASPIANFSRRMARSMSLALMPES
jgi:hypothetical protein